VKLIFVRHGKDDDSFRGGWSNLDLTDRGIAEAETLAEHLNSNRDRYDITKIISSDLQRCVSTARYISNALSLPVTYEPLIRETNNGLLAGMPNDEALRKYPGLFFSSLGMDERYPDGESPSEFYSRIKTWFEDFIPECTEKDGNTLIVTHGGVINVIYHLVKGIPWNNKNTPFKVSNCSIHILNLDSMTFESENMTEHLRR